MGNSHQDCQHDFCDCSRMGIYIYIYIKSHSEKEKEGGEMHRGILLSCHKTYTNKKINGGLTTNCTNVLVC